MNIDNMIRLEIRIIAENEEVNKTLKILRKPLKICKISQLVQVNNFQFELNR